MAKNLPISGGRADKELGSVCVGPSVGHGQCAHARVLQQEVLVTELVAIDGLASSSIVFCKVAALDTQKNKIKLKKNKE